MTTPPITALDREAAAAMLEAYRDRLTPDEQAESAMLAANIRAGLHDDAPRVVAFARRAAAERATSPAGDAGEVERLREALCVVRGSVGDLRKGFVKSIEPARWVEQLVHYIDAALRPQAGDADVVGEPGA